MSIVFLCSFRRPLFLARIFPKPCHSFFLEPEKLQHIGSLNPSKGRPEWLNAVLFLSLPKKSNDDVIASGRTANSFNIQPLKHVLHAFRSMQCHSFFQVTGKTSTCMLSASPQRQVKTLNVVLFSYIPKKCDDDVILF